MNNRFGDIVVTAYVAFCAGYLFHAWQEQSAERRRRLSELQWNVGILRAKFDALAPDEQASLQPTKTTKRGES